MDYGFAKMKVSQLFGLIFYRDRSPRRAGNDTLGQTTPAARTAPAAEVDLAAAGTARSRSGRQGRVPGIESPSTNSSVLPGDGERGPEALDIPYSFCQEFHQLQRARQALLQYEQSAKDQAAGPAGGCSTT
jgi:hypothetical protein